MRVVGEMLDLEEEAADEEIVEAAIANEPAPPAPEVSASTVASAKAQPVEQAAAIDTIVAVGASATTASEKRRARR
jgi:hypothetical protein